MKLAFDFLEFFAGGGMARLGLGDRWRCRFANDFDRQKCAAYAENFGDDDLIQADVTKLTLADLPNGQPDLAWASFPCQDLSLAGARGGLNAPRSGGFFGFWRLMEALNQEGRAPRIIAIENVTGLITSNNGADFITLVERLTDVGYTVSAIVIDARHFTPQSRPRIFILGFSEDCAPPLSATPAIDEYTPPALVNAIEGLSENARRAWGWLTPRPQTLRNSTLADIVVHDTDDWHSPDMTAGLLDAMSSRQRASVDDLLKRGDAHIGGAFRRMRMENDKRVQRVEARFDGMAGCLRTPAGGSSRQILLAIDKGKIRSRLMSPREAARLMGLPDTYCLPATTTSGLKLCGDGVCVPAVRWLAETILEPALDNARAAAA